MMLLLLILTKNQTNFGHYEAHPACLNRLHPLDYYTVAQHADYGKFCDFLVEETFSVTLDLKLTLEREQKSLSWVSQSFNNFRSAQQTSNSLIVGMKVKEETVCIKKLQ